MPSATRTMSSFAPTMNSKSTSLTHKKTCGRGPLSTFRLRGSTASTDFKHSTHFGSTNWHSRETPALKITAKRTLVVKMKTADKVGIMMRRRACWNAAHRELRKLAGQSTFLESSNISKNHESVRNNRSCINFTQQSVFNLIQYSRRSLTLPPN